jgi:excinuclease ABC subunit C
MGFPELKEKIITLPDSPGVYIMKSKRGEVLYVGKASSLRKRVRSYLTPSISSKVGILREKVEDIEYVTCDSEEQALILESALIKERKPKYNIALRDDKSYPYVEITKEEFPRLFISRLKKRGKSLNFGPYPKVKLLKASLSIIRKVFPYASCKVMPKSACLFYHLSLCPAPCIGAVSPFEYKENIENIIKILRGERKELMENLRKKMEELSKALRFEEATKIRDKLLALENLYSGKKTEHFLISLRNILNLPSLPLLIEAIDISSLRGKEAGGSLIVFRDGFPDKSSYRRYRIKEVEEKNDYAMVGEVVRRRYHRLLREKKRLPDLVIIDGGKGHLQKAKEELDKLALNIPIIGIAKKNEEIWLPFYEEPIIVPKDSPCLHLLQRIRDEAHRFAHKYHLLLRSKKVVSSKKREC